MRIRLSTNRIPLSVRRVRWIRWCYWCHLTARKAYVQDRRGPITSPAMGSTHIAPFCSPGSGAQRRSRLCGALAGMTMALITHATRQDSGVTEHYETPPPVASGPSSPAIRSLCNRAAIPHYEGGVLPTNDMITRNGKAPQRLGRFVAVQIGASSQVIHIYDMRILI